MIRLLKWQLCRQEHRPRLTHNLDLKVPASKAKGLTVLAVTTVAARTISVEIAPVVETQHQLPLVVTVSGAGSLATLLETVEKDPQLNLAPVVSCIGGMTAVTAVTI